MVSLKMTGVRNIFRTAPKKVINTVIIAGSTYKKLVIDHKFMLVHVNRVFR